MARISGVDLPKNKRMDIALTAIYGIGRVSAKVILTDAKIAHQKRADDLTIEEAARIRDVIESGYKVEGDKRKEVSLDIKRLMDLGCYRGVRHRKRLPARGQRTHSNARTRRRR